MAPLAKANPVGPVVATGHGKGESSLEASNTTNPPVHQQMKTLVLPVLGMTCAACQKHVEGALREANGIGSARVDLMRHRASVEFDPALTDAASIVAVIQGAGYDSVVPREAEKASGGEAGAMPTAMPSAMPSMMGMGEEAVSRVKALTSIGVGLVTMLLSMPLGMSSSNSSVPGAGDRMLMRTLPWFYEIPHAALGWTLLVVTGVLAVWAGGSIYAGAFKAAMHGESSMNTLVSLGTGVAFFYSAWVVVASTFGLPSGKVSGNVYFDSVLLILGFLLLGKWLEARARHRALASVDALARLQPSEARVRRAKLGHAEAFEEVMLPVDQVKIGDLVVILPGERIAVDAEIETGRTTVDESMLTGESVPLSRGVGERVLAGSLNYDGAITGRVESAGAGTTLSQIARLVESAQSSRAPMERLADRASAVFVPVVLGLAVATFLGWLLLTHDFTRAIVATVAVLVIACPCAMGLAVPAALTVAIGRGAQFGVLIKGGEALERLAGLNVIAMDKTGTLTEGKPSLAAVWSATEMSKDDLLRMAAAVEDRSSHPLAHAVVAGAHEKGLSWKAAEDVQVIPGRGLSAEIEGRKCLMGNAELMKDWGVSLAAQAPASAEGVTRLWIALSESSNSSNPSGSASLPGSGSKEAGPAYALAGFLDARDAVKPSAAAAVGWLRKHGMRVEMLTGDSATAAKPVAAAVGISDVASSLLPADKVSRIRALQGGVGVSRDQGVRGAAHVAMVGDGINDAAALAQADAGIAMGAGAALAQEAGDVLLLTSDPIGVVTAIALARKTVSVMRQNLVWAVGYNLIGIPLAAGLLYPAFHLTLTPWMAAAAMAFSSLSVLLNSLRLRGWKAPLSSALTASIA